MPVHKEPSAGTTGTTKSAVLEHTNLCFAVRSAVQAVAEAARRLQDGLVRSSAEVLMLLIVVKQ